MNLAAGGEGDNADDIILSDSIRPNGPVLDFGPDTEFQRCAARLADNAPLKVPSDGLCLYRVVAAAAVRPAEWKPLPLETKILVARRIKGCIVAVARASGDAATASRLEEGDGAENCPGGPDL
eukprot:9486554-Pyramimonas_sp.AAC.1